MDLLKINIVDCSRHSYKLQADGIDRYYEEALKRANKLYLHLFDQAYRLLMFEDFNPLWISSRKKGNEIDAKDGFWEMNYFFFNISLIQILYENYTVTVTDMTGKPFYNRDYFYRFLETHHIQLEVKQPRRKKDSLSSYLKKKVYFLFHDLRKKLEQIVKHLVDYDFNLPRIGKKKDVYIWECLKRKPANKKKLYLYVQPVKKMDLKRYYNWRYARILEDLDKRKMDMLLFSTKDFEGTDQIDIPFINVTRLVTIWDRAGLLFKALLLRWKIRRKVKFELSRPDIKPEYKVFLQHIPVNLYQAMVDQCGFDRLFASAGPGLLLYRGPLVNKGASLYNYSARKRGIRILSVAGRVFTPTRLSNLFAQAHLDPRYPCVTPHALIVFDQLSQETITRQNMDISIYLCPSGILGKKEPELPAENCKPLIITVILQKQRSDNMEYLINQVVTAVKEIKQIRVHLKTHPHFPMPEKLADKYRLLPFLTILAHDTPLKDAIDKSHLCITCYSSAALEFAKKGKPVIWTDHVTLNSLFFTEVQKRLGITVKNAEDLKRILHRMSVDVTYYTALSKRCYSRITDLSCGSRREKIWSIPSVIEKEFKNAEVI